MKNLIMSYATNINPNDLSKFVGSIRNILSVDEADVVVITNSTAPEVTDLSEELSVQLLPATTICSQVQSSLFLRILFRLIFAALRWSARLSAPELKRRQVHDVLAAIWAHPITARHFFYMQFLEQHPKYSLVMLSDARDVVFQANPFNGLEEGVIHAFLQDETLIYGQDNIDTDWYRGMYGTDGIAQVLGKPIACAGTVFGDVQSLLQLERAMFAEIARVMRGVVDQVIFNKLINFPDKSFKVKIHQNGLSNVLTFGGVSDHKFQIVGDHVFIDGHLPAVLHQYDRVPTVSELIDRGASRSWPLEQHAAQRTALHR